MRKKTSFMRLFSLVSLFLIGISMYAQEMTVTGSVTDGSNGELMPGVTVQLKGTTSGTVTSIDGDFSLKAKVGDVLIFSFIGYVTQELPVASAQVGSVKLESEAIGLDDVVVIGYGSQKKSDKTGAVVAVNSKDVNGGAVTDAMQTMQGKASGVMITKKGGNPNDGFTVNVRGASGFKGDTQPLYVIDGVAGVDPSTVPSADIETFNILKDAASTAIYGSRGANGVVLITTKTGSKDKGSVNASAKISVDRIANKYDVMNREELLEYVSLTGQGAFTDNGGDVDWQNEVTQLGLLQDYNVNFSGGNDKGAYYASLTSLAQDGIIKGTSKNRTIAKINASHKALDNKMTLFASASQTIEHNEYQSFNNWENKDVIFQALQHAPTDPIYNPDGSYFQRSGINQYQNPLSVIDGIEDSRDAKFFAGNFKVDYEFIPGLMASLNLGYIRDDFQKFQYTPTDAYAKENEGSSQLIYENNAAKSLEAFLNYTKSLNDVHNLNIMAGYSYLDKTFNKFNAGGRGESSSSIKYNDIDQYLVIDRNDVGSYASMSRLIGYFTRFQYNYNSKYYASASIRADGSTKFGTNNQWGYFPTVAAGWTISQEEFMQGVDVLNTLKLRASYGITGNQNMDPYKSQTIYEPKGPTTDPETGDLVMKYEATSSANPDLTWESTAEINIGIDFGFLDSKISGSLEVYQKNTTDLLGEYKVPSPPYPSTTLWKNSGEVSNKGVELNIQYFAIDHKNFKWKTNLTASHNTQKYEDLGDQPLNDQGVIKDGVITGPGMINDQTDYVIGIAPGGTRGAFYVPVYQGLDANGMMQFKSKLDPNVMTTNYADAQREFVGNATPKAEIGWSNYFTIYKNWTADIAIRSLIGQDMYNASEMAFDNGSTVADGKNAFKSALDWVKEGRSSSSNAAICDYYVEDASFVKLDYITIGYNVPLGKITWLKDLKLSLSANNLLTITKYSGIDPETSVNGTNYGIDMYNVYPKARTITFGLSTTF